MQPTAFTQPHRQLGQSDLKIAPVAFGGWPIAGVTTLDTNDAASLATIQACFDLGINHIDTAHVYGPHGESERLIGKAIAGRRDELVLASKCGIHYAGDEMVNDARPEVLQRECEESLRRLGVDCVDLLYLHAPDPNVPLSESAGGLRELVKAGKTRYVGVSNLQLEQIEEFQAVCPITAVQLPYNMLQRGIEQKTIPWCRAQNVGVMVYWVLMKGLLAGRLPRDYQFHARDSRQNYPMYHGEEWQKNQDFVDRLREIATASGRSVPQLVIAWTIAQAGVTGALCGAKRAWQIEESAGALSWQLTPAELSAVAAALAERGPAVASRVFE